MPAEILNRLEASVPEIEASFVNENIGSSMKADSLDPLESELRAMKFIWKLPIVSIDFLHEDEKFCGMCDRKYDDEFRVCGRKESPCCLPCGHIAGHQCLRKYLSPYECGFTKCPFCKVDFPQTFTDPVEPTLATSDLAWVDVDDHEVLDEGLSRQVSQLSKDSGAPSDEIKRYLSIDEVLERSRSQTEVNMGTDVQDFATQATDPAEIGDEEFPKNRKNGGGPSLARAAMKAVDLIAKKF
ncbi:hypothetical protein HO173_005920 [Letharia columbiana]|uniref:RING-type domain-containing protein n=1 Tax=Letharia columbiana TaxID=112416 RepID=A0A8H6FVT3_9LECA|nr:uncharacterized protein HO173_005920 [Letharia columbiana]KAF6235725.1 hypothetical protein HO173_005920 [Letharia columbiana]